MMKNIFEKGLLASVAMVGVFSMQLDGAWATSVAIWPGTTGTTEKDDSAIATLDCVSSDCAALGYTQSSTDCAGQKSVRCPFDTSKYFCVSSSSGSTGCATNTYPMMDYVSDTLGFKHAQTGEYWWSTITLYPEPISSAPNANGTWNYTTSGGATVTFSCTHGYSWNGLHTGGGCNGTSTMKQYEYDIAFNFKCKFKVGSDGTTKEFYLSYSLTAQNYNTLTNGFSTEDICKNAVKQQTDGCYKFVTDKQIIKPTPDLPLDIVR